MATQLTPKEEEAARLRREYQRTLYYPNGAPMYGQSIKDNGDHIMLDDQGKRSIFCDVDE